MTPAQQIAVHAGPALADSGRMAGVNQADPRHQPADLSRQLTLQLHPAELGSVSVRIRARGNAIDVSIEASTERAAHAIRSDIAGLVQSFGDLGLDCEQMSVSVAQRGDTFAGFASGEATPGPGQDGNRRSSQAGRWQIPETTMLAQSSEAPDVDSTRAHGARAGRLVL